MDFTVVRNACSQFRGMRSRKFAQRGAVCCHLSFPASYAAFRFDAACHPRFRADATTGHRSPSPPLPRLTDGSPSMREMRIHPRVCDCELNHRIAQAYIGRKKRKEEKKRNSASWLRSICTASFHDDEFTRRYLRLELETFEFCRQFSDLIERQ